MSHRVPSTLVPLYREEIYTQYLALRCLATKKVCGLAATSPSLELFEGKKKKSPFCPQIGRIGFSSDLKAVAVLAVYT
jgi:hypothetical protein